MDPSREELKSSPHEMYMLALRTGGRLPDDLHRSMILWGYDERHEGIVKGYFGWLEKCEEIRKDRKESERRMRSIDFQERTLLVLLGMFVASALFIFAEIIKNA